MVHIRNAEVTLKVTNSFKLFISTNSEGNVSNELVPLQFKKSKNSSCMLSFK